MSYATRSFLAIASGGDPLRDTWASAPGAGVALPRWESGGVSLESLQLESRFDWTLLGPEVRGLYFCAVAWDLSGAPPRVRPLPSESATPLPLISIGGPGFLGAELALREPGPVVGALYLRVVVVESGGDATRLAASMRSLRDAVARGALAGALAALITEINPPALDAVSCAVVDLDGVIASALRGQGARAVTLLAGVYGADCALRPRTETYEQRGAAMTLQFR
jgi:hypothetical protein